MDERTVIGQILRQARVLRGMSQQAAADAAGVKQQTWSKIEKGDQAIDLEQLDALSRAVGLEREHVINEAARLMGRLSPKQPAAFSAVRKQELAILETVRAGAWLRADDHDQDQPRTHPAAPDPRFPEAAQWLSEVSGDSVNELRIYSGDLVHLVSIEAIGYQPKTGDIVELERLRFSGREREYSLKQVEMTANGPLFWPRSTNPQWRLPLDPRAETDEGEDVQVLVRGLVIACIRRF